MDGLTFVVELIKALAWPGATLLIVFLLREQLRGLLPLLTKLKYKDLEVVFGREAAEARADADALPAPAGQQTVALPSVSAEVGRLLAISPRSAVMESWRELENSARQAAIRHNVAQPAVATTSPTKIAKLLGAYHILDPSQIGLFHDLRALRNQAAHAPEFVLEEDAARDYIEAASRLSAFLDAV